MVIYPEITIVWGGEEYQVKADFDLINKIEQKVNLGILANRINNSDVPLTNVAFLYSSFLKKAGCDISGDEVFAAMLGQSENDEEIDQQAIISLAVQCLYACFPVIEKKQGKGKAKSKKVA